MAAAVAGVTLALCATVARGENDLPPGARDLFVCGAVYTLHAGDLLAAGDEPGAEEFYYLGDAVTQQATATLEAFGYGDEQIDDIAASIAMTTGFSYGAGEAEVLLAQCFADLDTP